MPAPKRKSSTAVTPATPAPVPALPYTGNMPAMEIDSGDIAFSKLYFAHPMSKIEGVVGGTIIVATGEEDPNPEVLWDPKDEDRNPLGVLFHVVGMRKGLSLSEDGGELETWAFGDPDASPDAWTTYNYAIVLPEHDDTTLFKMLLTRTKTAAAKQINTYLKKSEGTGPPWNLAFRVTSAERKNTKGKYYVPRVTRVEADPAHVNLAGELASLIADAPSPSFTPRAATAESDEPSI